MKIFRRILPAAFFCAALCLPLFAQEEEGADNSEAMQGEMQGDTTAEQPAGEAPEKTEPKKARPKKAAAAKPAAKKKAAKKKAPVSEYKFTNDNPTPTYKFDKRSDPIVKETKKKKKKATKKDASGSSGSVPKLKKVKSFNEADAPDAGGIKLPEGVNAPAQDDYAEPAALEEEQYPPVSEDAAAGD